MTAPDAPVLGTPNSGTTGAVTYALPAHQAYDALFLPTEVPVTAGIVTPPTGGWAHVTDSPRAQGSNVVALSAFWKRAVSGAEANPQIPGQSDHQIGIPFRVRNAKASGNPWNVEVPDGQATGTTARVFDATITTITPDSLVVYMLATSADLTSANFGGAITTAPTGLTGWTILNQTHTTNGNGGGVLVAYGFKATAGVVGMLNWSFTTTAAWSGIALAIPFEATPTETERWGIPL